jgi:separase
MIENIDEKSLISTVVEQKYGIRFQLGELLRIMFLEGTRREETADRLVEKVAVLVELLVCLGGTIQRLSLEESEDAINLTRLSEDYEAVLSVIINLIRRITDSFQQTSAQPVLLASLYIVASSALLPYRSFYHDALAEENGANLPVPSFTLAKRLAEKAKRCVETPSESDPDLEVLLVSTRASIWYYCHHLSRLRGHPQERFDDKIQQLCVLFYDAVEPFRLHSESASPLHAFSSSCLLWSLSNFRGLLEWDGDILRAALVAQWTCCLIPDHERFASYWNHAATTNACLSADILPNPATSIESKSTLGTLVGLLETPQVMDTLNHLFEVEFLISQFRLGLRLENGPQVDTGDQSRTLLVLQRKIAEIENSSALEVSVFAEWVLASIELTHTEISEINGDLCGALSHNKLCMKRCQTLSSILRRAHGLLHTYPFWARVAFSTLYCQVNEREKYCLRRTVLLYSRLGDYRKAEAYAVSAMLSTGVHDGPASKSRSKFSELLLSEASIKSSNEKLFFRLRMEVQAMATSLDHVASELSNKSVDNIVVSQNSVGSSQRSLSVQMDDSITLLSCKWLGFNWMTIKSLSFSLCYLPVGDMLYGDSVTGFQQEFAEYYKQALLKHEEFVEACSIQQKTPLCMEAEEMIPLVSHMKLRRVRCLLEGTGALSFDGQKQARELCEEVVRCCSTVGATKAWAYFYLGCLDLDNSRRTGALSNLWAGHSNHFEHELFRDQRVMTACSMETEDNIQGARKHFLAAASLLGSATDVFRRKVIRNLALATGPESGQPVSGMSASSLILTSVGRLTRHHALRSMECHIPAGGEGRNPSELENAFLSFDSGFNNVVERDHKIKDFYARLEKMLPADWTFVAPAICPSGEILMTSIFIADSGSLQSRTICIFPGENKGGAYDEILQPLDEIIQSSQNYLKGVDSSNASEHFAKDSAKREWWNERKKQDSDLKELIERVEAEYFGFSLARKLFHGNEVLTEDCSYGDDDSSDLSCGNLASKFEAACDLSDRLCDHDDIRLAIDDREDFDSEDERLALQKLTVPVLKSRLHDLEVSESEMRKLRKAELIDLLVRTEQNRRKNTVKYEKPDPRNYLSESSKRCTFLILDENLHRFPFEGMTFLAQKAVCRVPSLPFVFASLHEQQLAKKEGPILVDPATTTYVLDPENNLQGTRARVLPVLERLGSQTNWNWSGVVGEIPPPSLFEEGLSKDDGLMLYFGHGGGQVCFSRRQIETMSGGQGGTFRSCKASVILMGCSSGRLVSVNRKHTESTKEFPLYYDPEGISISYLCAGAPCVVGNLWDVTDHDIDR